MSKCDLLGEYLYADSHMWKAAFRIRLANLDQSVLTMTLKDGLPAPVVRFSMGRTKKLLSHDSDTVHFLRPRYFNQRVQCRSCKLNVGWMMKMRRRKTFD